MRSIVSVVCALTVVAARPASRAADRAAAVPSARVERAVPFQPGEALTYDVSWSSYLTAGTATVTVKEKKPSFGSTAYYIVAEGRPTPLLAKLYTLYYKADTLLDASSLLPQRGSVYSEEGKRHRLKVTRFDQAARKAEFELQTDKVMKKELPLPPYAQDALSAIYVLRAIPLKTGGTMTMPVIDSGRAYKVRVVVGARETVRSGIGSMAAWRVTPTILADGGRPGGPNMALWISDDARRLPVKLEVELAVGRFVLSLRQATGVQAD